MSVSHSPGDDRAYESWLASQHRPAHARRTADVHAAFFLPVLEPGMSVLDVGCGPGTITAGLAAAVAPGECVGLDTSPAGEWAELVASRANLRFVAGDGNRLPFGDSMFDAVFIHFVLQHVEAPSAILGEAFRVLRPGGVIGVADADFGGSIIAPATDGIDASLELMARLRESRGGNPCIGRELARLLDEGGFIDVVAGARAECEWGDRAVRTAQVQARYFAAPELRVFALDHGLATEDALSRMAGAWEAWGASPGAFWARFTCHAVGRKPG